MFSGIIQSTGIVSSIESNGTTSRVEIQSPMSSALYIDQSIAHDGICLTVTQIEHESHWVDVVKETLSKTTFAQIKHGQVINLEKSLSLSTLLDGHLVQGHVDTTLQCIERSDEKGSWNLKFNLPKEFANLVIPRGSICLNGVSLTIANLFDDSFEVAIIPYTFNHTNFKFIQPGDWVNVEFDLIGKYLLRQNAIIE
jgi:riboflavin synthase